MCRAKACERGVGVLRGSVCVDPEERKRTEVNAVDLKSNAEQKVGQHALAMVEEGGKGPWYESHILGLLGRKREGKGTKTLRLDSDPST